MSRLIQNLLRSVIFCLFCTGLNATVIRVDINSPCTMSCDGSTWDLAYVNLQDAIDAASAGDSIWVAEGKYLPTKPSGYSTISRDSSFLLKEGVKIYGGFSTVDLLFDDRDSENNTTVLSGDLDNDGTAANNALHVILIRIDLSENTILDGFTISDGNANASIMEGQDQSRSGAAVLMINLIEVVATVLVRTPTSVSMKFIDCIFENNNANARGGAIDMECYDGSTFTPQFIGCTFQDNFGFSQGGAIRTIAVNNVTSAISTNSPSFDRCIFRRNRNTNGGGAAMLVGTDNNGLSQVKYSNCLFEDNVSTSGAGGAFQLRESDGNIEATYSNCTFSDNIGNTFKSTFWITGGEDDEYMVGFNNCIFNNSSCASFPISIGGGTAVFSNTLIDTTYAKMLDAQLSNFTIDTSASGMIFDQSAMLNPDFSLTNMSPAINTGNNDSVVGSLDLANEPRIVHTVVDMGAFEFQGPIMQPIAMCSDITIGLDMNGMVSITADLVDDGTTGAEMLSISKSSFNCRDIGNNIIVLTATNDFGARTCNATVTVNVGASNLNNIIGRDTSICNGSIIDLSGLLTATMTDTLSYGFSIGNYGLDMIVSPSDTTTYFVQDSNRTNGCIDTALIKVSVNPQPSISGRDTSICEGDTVDLRIFVIGDTLNTLGFGSSFGTYDLTSSKVSPDETTTYYVRDSSSITGCVDTAEIIITVMNGMACLMEFASGNELRFGDPCNCEDFIVVDRDIYFRDTLQVMGPAGQSLVFTQENSSDFYDGTGSLMAEGATFSEGPDGTYRLEFFKLAGVQAVGNVLLNDDGPIPVDPDSLEVCERGNCPNLIPTLGQWGIILLFLSLIIFSVMGIQKRVKLTL